MVLRTVARSVLQRGLRVITGVAGGLSIPSMLRQLLFAGRPAYYTEAEWSGNSHLLKDYSSGVGSLREKRLGFLYDLTSDEYILVAGLTGSETVVSSEGTSTPTISAGRIDFTAGTCWDLVLSDGSHYPLQEETGTTAYDISGNDHHGTITGAVTSGVGSIHQPDAGVAKSYPNDEGYSPRIDFAGVSVNADVLTPSFKGVSSSFECWFKSDAISESATVAYRIINALSEASSSRFGFGIDAGNLILFSVGGATVLQTPVSVGQTYHVVMSHNYGVSYSLYVNGVLIGSADTGTIAGVGKLSIGSLDAANRFFNGMIWNAKIYSKALSADEVAFNYTNGVDGTDPGTENLLAHYPLKGNTGSVAEDVSGNGNDGTISGNFIAPIIPAKSPTQDALGGLLTYTGRAPQPGLVKDYGWQGNGSSVYVDLGEPLVPFSADFVLEFPFYLISGFGYFFDCRSAASSSNRWVISSNLSGVDGTLAVGFSTVLAPSSIQLSGISLNEWHIGKLIRVGDVVTLEVDNGELSVSAEYAYRFGQANQSLLARDPVLAATQPTPGIIGPVSITTGGITTTYAPIPGTRNVAKLLSSGTGSIITDAVKNGVLADLYTLGDGSWRSPAVENGARWTSQNLLVHSETFTGWTLQSCALSAHDTTLIDELNDAKKLSAITTPNLARIAQITSPVVLVAATQYTFSVYVKGGTHSVVELGIYQHPAAVLEFRWYDLSDGSSGISFDNFTAGAISATLVGDGWYRVSLTFTPPNTQTSYFYIGMKGAAMNSSTNIYIGGAQLNIGATAQDYEKTVANAWPVQALVPAAPGATVAANGNAINIPANKHPRGVLVDRTGGIIAPLDYQMETDNYTAEEYNDTTTENTVDKRVGTNYSDRHGAATSDISGVAYFD